MSRFDYTIFTDDGKKFCERHQTPEGDSVFVGPKGLTVTARFFMEQYGSPSNAYSRRDKRRPKK